MSVPRAENPAVTIIYHSTIIKCKLNMLTLVHGSWCKYTYSELVDEGSNIESQRWLLTLDSTFQEQRVWFHQHTVNHNLCREDASSFLQQTPYTDHGNTFYSTIRLTTAIKCMAHSDLWKPWEARGNKTFGWFFFPPKFHYYFSCAKNGRKKW